MVNLRNYARGRECQIRLPGICNHDPATTVLAHYRMPGTGLALKPPNLVGAHSCSACHDAIDGRVQTEYGRDYLRLAHLEGMARTIALLVAQGIVE